jgi:hypothetical protein
MAPTVLETRDLATEELALATATIPMASAAVMAAATGSSTETVLIHDP